MRRRVGRIADSTSASGFGIECLHRPLDAAQELARPASSAGSDGGSTPPDMMKPNAWIG